MAQARKSGSEELEDLHARFLGGGGRVTVSCYPARLIRMPSVSAQMLVCPRRCTAEDARPEPGRPSSRAIARPEQQG